MERSFFIEQDDLKQIQPDLTFEEAAILHAFDTPCEPIYAIAAKVYARGLRGSYDIVAADF